MAKAVQKQVWGIPSIAVANQIDDSDKVSALHAAHYRLDARLRELEGQFEAKACELRAAYLSEVESIHSNEG